MALPTTQQSREYQNFSDNGDGTTSRFIKVVGSGITFKWDAFSVAYPNTTTEIYSFFEGGLSGTLKGTATIVYTNASKESLSSGVINAV